MPEDELGADEATQDTPESGTEDQSPAEAQASPAIDWDTDDNPYKQRYGDLRPQYDRMQNFVSALQNPETQAEVLRQFGIELEDDEGDLDETTDEPLTRAEFQAYLERSQEAQSALEQEEQALDSDAAAIEADLKAIQKEHGELSDAELDLLLAVALQNRDDEGNPRFKDAFDNLHSIAKTRHDKWRESKRADQVATGQAGTEKIDLSNDDARVGALANMLEAAEAE